MIILFSSSFVHCFDRLNLKFNDIPSFPVTVSACHWNCLAIISFGVAAAINSFDDFARLHGQQRRGGRNAKEKSESNSKTL